ncbi:MAG: HisA/HisF-related TIM barrel protein [Actinomycetota bacterium]|jgi:cyclase
MPFRRLIPCLDVAHGRVVKGVKFVGLRDVGDPVDLATAYSRGGADELIFLDIAATVNELSTMIDVVARVADVVNIPFTVGGGIRSVDDATRIIDAGADRVSINSAAIETPELISRIAERYGSQAVVVAMDVADGVVFTHGGSRATERSFEAWAVEAEERGAGELLVTSINFDGERSGYDLATLRALRGLVQIPLIASGGAGSAAHVAEVLEVTEAALVASIVHDDPANFPAIRRTILETGVTLRPYEETDV